MKTIKVLHNYGGALTRELRILPGEYAIDDERLFGAGEHLVENGHAVVTKDEPDELETEPEEVLGVPELTKAELVEKLTALGVSIPRNANKDKLVELLGNHDSSESDV